MSLTFFPSMFCVFLHNTLLLIKSQQNNLNKINFLNIFRDFYKIVDNLAEKETFFLLICYKKTPSLARCLDSLFITNHSKIVAILVLIRSIATTFDAPSGMIMSA